MSFGVTVITVTSGTGRCGGGASFEQPAASAAMATIARAGRRGANMGGASVVVAERARRRGTPVGTDVRRRA